MVNGKQHDGPHIPPTWPSVGRRVPRLFHRTLFFIFLFLFFFFFQAEDGIRDFHVTGVQTCALPISWLPRRVSIILGVVVLSTRAPHNLKLYVFLAVSPVICKITPSGLTELCRNKIGRASCRERV